MAAAAFRHGAGHGRAPLRSAAGDLLPAGTLLAAGLAALLLASFSAAGNAGQYLVVLPPWSGAGQTFSLIAAAEGTLVEPGRFPNIAIAASADPGFAGAARKAGAWIVVPSPLLAGCGGTRVREGRP